MVDPNPIREPVEETFEEEELAPIIMAQATVHPRPVDVGEGSSGRKTKRKRRNKESYKTAKARTTNNHYIRHAWFTWFAENVEHKETFRRYNTPGTSMGIRRFVEHLCELGRQTYEQRRQVIPALPPWDKPIKTTLELWAQQVPSEFKEEYEKWIKTKVFKDWSDGGSRRRRDIVGRLATPEGKASLLMKVEMWQRWFERARHVQLGKALGKELGMEGVVSHVAKKCDAVGTNSAWVMMHKELASFAETHCAIVQPIACHNIEAELILVYPYWNGRDIYQWMRLEHVTRGTRLPDNSGISGNLIIDHPRWFPDPEDFETLHNWKIVEIFRAHRLEIMCTFDPRWISCMSTIGSIVTYTRGTCSTIFMIGTSMKDSPRTGCRRGRTIRVWSLPCLVILGWPNKCMLQQATMVSNTLVLIP
ncbi:hypothetical protein R1sor_025968 [Riccia sorocarpa]|uniref:Uncharacterized protein n=1 Tax=Riccia sorocarpa TaxID=122646 RepID=A0ABD3GA48_9MARC